MADLEAQVQVALSVVALDPHKTNVLVVRLPRGYSPADLDGAHRIASGLRELGIAATICVPQDWDVQFAEMQPPAEPEPEPKPLDEWMQRYDAVERDYADYVAVLRRVQEESRYCGPHCDSFVLHPIPTCESCAMPCFAPLHDARRELKIAYTGQVPSDDGERPCPAAVLRPVEDINLWDGNTPRTAPGDEG